VIAATLVEPGRIVLADVPEPKVGPGDVGITVGGVGLCGSDMAVFRGTWTAPSYPWVMGHEAFGTIERVGERVDPGRIGELVVVEPNVACGSCPECERGRTSACRYRRSVGMNRQGALAQRLVVPAHLAWTIVAGAATAPLSPQDLVCIEPLAVVEAAMRRLGADPPEDVLIVGSGAQGLLMALALRRRGVRVHVSDPIQERVAFAVERLGASDAALDEDRGFDLVVDTAGVPEAMAVAVRHAAVGATILELGLVRRPLELSAETLVRRQLLLRGSLTYDHPHDFRAAVDLVVSGAVAPGQVVSGVHPFAETQRAFETAPTARGKTWIRL
jgi:alcohol dehydrogenase/L-iditol 2-dehydrogenase